MYIYCVDDNPFQMIRARELVEFSCKEKNFSNYEIIECVNGAELLKAAEKNKPSLVLMDINMPVLDGLTALVKLRAKYKTAKIIMVSSENSKVIGRFSTGVRPAADDEKKNELLNKVVERVKSGVEEQGKINSVLVACGNLGLDPVKVAKELGADDFIQKPFEPNVASKVLIKHMSAGMVLN